MSKVKPAYPTKSVILEADCHVSCVLVGEPTEPQPKESTMTHQTYPLTSPTTVEPKAESPERSLTATEVGQRLVAYAQIVGVGIAYMSVLIFLMFGSLYLIAS